MQQIYISKGKELLKLLINNGFEGYFVGEAVRNTIMNIDFKRADIITNAKIDDLKRINSFIFDENATVVDEATIKVVYSDYDFYFRSFSTRQNDDVSDNRSVLTRHYSSNLLDDLSTKNFTINAIAMSYSGKITDAHSGCEDIKNKRIRTISNSKTYFNNNPIDILEAIKIAGEIKFSISDKTLSAMSKKSKLLLNTDKGQIYEKLNDILKSPYSKKAFGYLINNSIYKNVPSLSKGIKAISKIKKQVEIDDLLLASFVLNGAIDEDYLSYVNDKETFEKVFEIAKLHKKGLYDNATLFMNGINICQRANYINYLIKRDHLRNKQIKKDYDELSIKDYQDLKYTSDDIKRITGLGDDPVVQEIIDEAVFNILNGTLRNDYDEIEKFVLKQLTVKQIYFDISRTNEDSPRIIRDDDEVITESINSDYSPRPILTEDEQALSDSINEANQVTSSDDYTNHRLRILEERLDEQDRLLQEKNERLKELENQKILETTSKMVNTTLEQIRKDSQIATMIKDIDNFELEYRNFIVDYIEKEKNNE